MNGCPYCTTDGDRKPIPTSGGGELEVVKIIPMPAIDLTTGKKDDFVDKPFWAMNFIAFEGELEEFVRINNCPMCGRALKREPIPMVHCNNCGNTFPHNEIWDFECGDGYDPECDPVRCPRCGKEGCLIEEETGTCLM